MATAGDYFALGDILAQQRRSDVAMNQPVPHGSGDSSNAGDATPELDGNDP
jgi:hypothetical protein